MALAELLPGILHLTEPPLFDRDAISSNLSNEACNTNCCVNDMAGMDVEVVAAVDDDDSSVLLLLLKKPNGSSSSSISS